MVAQLAKGIKPKRLRVDKTRLNLLNELRSEGRAIKREFEKTIATWEGEKPTFKILVSLKGGDAVVLVGAGGNTKGAQKWQWLNDGTPRHPIAARRVPNLIFRHGSGFRAKTKVKTFSSFPGANTGPWQRRKEVIHPGIKARDWTGEIVRLRRRQFNRRISKAARV